VAFYEMIPITIYGMILITLDQTRPKTVYGKTPITFYEKFRRTL